MKCPRCGDPLTLWTSASVSYTVGEPKRGENGIRELGYTDRQVGEDDHDENILACDAGHEYTEQEVLGLFAGRE